MITILILTCNIDDMKHDGMYMTLFSNENIAKDLYKGYTEEIFS